MDRRARSLAAAAQLGYHTNPSLPTLGNLSIAVDRLGLAKRMLCSDAIVAVAHGFPREVAHKWLRDEGLLEDLSASQEAMITGARAPDLRDKLEVNALYALAWSGGLLADITFNQQVPSTLATLFPNLNLIGGSAIFCSRVQLRPTEVLLDQLDLAYCLHWSIRDAQIRGKRAPGLLDPNAVVERRRGLEWLFSGANWDEIELDT